ncbi:MAG: transposase [Synergistaceae bacterium]|nr:transposase [Synergistaceae bacterium]
MSNAAKNEKIKQSMYATRERHKNMTCRVFELKLNTRKMSISQYEQLTRYFREAKWRRNSIVADFANASRKTKSAIVKVGDVFEERPFSILGSQVVQDIYDSVRTEMKILRTKKEKGEKVGKLKLKSVCNCVPLRQYNTTYRIDFVLRLVRIQNVRKSFRVHGLEQIPQDADITNAKLLRKASGFYLNVTCFVPKEQAKQNGRMVGIDFGIGHSLTLSSGEKIDICIPESKGVKLASKKMNQSYKRTGKKKTNNHKRLAIKLCRAYERDTNRRLDKAKKVIHEILSRNDFVAIQDEMIHNWHKGLFGKQVQHSAMGYIKAKLKNNFKAYVISRSYPSTQICPVCGNKTKHPLKKRDYDCNYCGFHHEARDVKSAQSILERALNEVHVSLERRAQSLVEADTATPISRDICASIRLRSKKPKF